MQSTVKTPNYYFLLLILVLLIPATVFSQIDNIKKRAAKDKSENDGTTRSSTGYSASDNDDDNLGAFIITKLLFGAFRGIGIGTIAAQNSALAKRDSFPERVSLDLTPIFGYHATEHTSLSGASLRGNWGIFASDVRYSYMKDYSGALKNWDWQVLMLRIPIRSFKLEYGIGFTNLVSPKNSWFESSIGFELGLLKHRAVIKSAYRWTEQKSDSKRFRQEANCYLSYEIKRFGNVHLSPVLGITHRNYYDENIYNFINVGVRVSLY